MNLLLRPSHRKHAFVRDRQFPIFKKTKKTKNEPDPILVDKHSVPLTLPFGTESVPSGFLSGITANDPVTGVPHSFNDLALRQQRLEELLCSSCSKGFVEIFSVLTFNPTKMVH